VLLLLLVMPAALLLMICMLERYERLIDAPARPLQDDDDAAPLPTLSVGRETPPDLAAEVA
jgi:hypothetical protein